MATRSPAGPAGPVVQPVQPQAHRQARRARLHEQSRVLAYRICEVAGLSPNGARLASKAGTRAVNDLQAVIVMVNKAVNECLGVEAGSRRELSVDEIEAVLRALESIGDSVQADVIARLS